MTYDDCEPDKNPSIKKTHKEAIDEAERLEYEAERIEQEANEAVKKHDAGSKWPEQ